MGNATSSPFESALQVLETIAGPQPLDLQNSLAWAPLFSAGATPLASFDPSVIQKEIRPHTASLVINNVRTLNCQRLIFAICRHLSDISAATSAVGSANAVHILRAILKDLVEQLNARQLLQFVEIPRSVLEGEHGPELQAEFHGLTAAQSLTVLLARSVLRTLVELPPNAGPGAYLLQFEIANLLLIMASSQLYTQLSNDATPHNHASTIQHVFLNACIRQQDLAGNAVHAFLTHYISSMPPPSGLTLYATESPRTALYFVKAAAGAVANTVLWLPYTAVSLLRRGDRAKAQSKQNSCPLADVSVVALLVLYFYVPPSRTETEVSSADNQIRHAMQHLRNADDTVSTEVAPEAGLSSSSCSASNPTALISYASLFEALGRSLLLTESSTLLLYTLLHGTPHFNDYCIARADLDCLVLPILQLLYLPGERSANQLYMLLIVLLMLSSDPTFAQQVHRIRLASVPFYTERPLTKTTLGSVLIVILLRVAHYNLAHLKDVYLSANTLATLANLAPHMTNLSSHASQRLVSLLQSLAKKKSRLQQREASDLETAHLMQDAEQTRLLEVQLYNDFERIIFEIINAILVNNLPSNPELVYTLLHRQQSFEAFNQDSHYADLMENIITVTDFFTAKIDSAFATSDIKGGLPTTMGSDATSSTAKQSVRGLGPVSAERVLEVIKLHSRGWRRDRLRSFPELRFSYEEESSPEAFFIPFVWSLAVGLPWVPWTVSSITAFQPISSPKDATPDTASNTAEKHAYATMIYDETAAPEV